MRGSKLLVIVFVNIWLLTQGQGFANRVAYDPVEINAEAIDIAAIGTIVDKTEFTYDQKGLTKTCAVELTIKVDRAWKGEEDSFKLLTTDLELNYVEGKKYLFLLELNQNYDASQDSEPTFNCDYRYNYENKILTPTSSSACIPDDRIRLNVVPSLRLNEKEQEIEDKLWCDKEKKFEKNISKYRFYSSYFFQEIFELIWKGNGNSQPWIRNYSWNSIYQPIKFPEGVQRSNNNIDVVDFMEKLFVN